MNTLTKSFIVGTLAGSVLSQGAFAAGSITEAITSGSTSGKFNLRYEAVDQDNGLKDSDLLSLRSSLTYKTGAFQGWSAGFEFEDSRGVAGFSSQDVAPGNGVYSVIADPSQTELDQAFLQYNHGGFTAKAGRQVINLDNWRFVGNVVWRQDNQTFDALRLNYAVNEDFAATYIYIGQRNRIFGEAADFDSKDSLLNLSYKTPYGKLVGYGYLLSLDNNTDNALDTVGVSWNGNVESFKYKIEIAKQTSEAGTVERDTDYLGLEGAFKVGGVTAKVGYELLGSDNGMAGFATPLATLHKFQGFADQFLGTPATGLVDVYVGIVTKVSGAKFVLTYHDFSADESTPAIDDLGSEVNLVLAKKFAKNYSGGLKYAAYSAGDAAAGKVDTNKLWLWTTLSF